MKIYVDSNNLCFINEDVYPQGVFQADFSANNTIVNIYYNQSVLVKNQ
jgi:hypothetical protein